MKKNLGSLALALSLTLALGCAPVLAEEEVKADAESTAAVYTIFYTTEDLAGVTDNNGFISGVGLSEKNAIVLNEDGTYEYIKMVGNLEEDADVVAIYKGEADAPDICLTYAYNGTYTQEGDQVTLGIPEDCVFSEEWGEIAAGGYLDNTSGKASDGDISSNKEGVERDPLDNFGSEVYKFSGHDAEVMVTVAEDGTYTYNEVASSDDD